MHIYDVMQDPSPPVETSFNISYFKKLIYVHAADNRSLLQHAVLCRVEAFVSFLALVAMVKFYTTQYSKGTHRVCVIIIIIYLQTEMYERKYDCAVEKNSEMNDICK